ncbi:TPA: hypothetical protein DCQ44_02825 [Candidatus Taylorbacteria bacterium]|nr:hypothetical protein [Candidatus Taylorbacteria bacterium]
MSGVSGGKRRVADLPEENFEHNKRVADMLLKAVTEVNNIVNGHSWFKVRRVRRIMKKLFPLAETRSAYEVVIHR